VGDYVLTAENLITGSTLKPPSVLSAAACGRRRAGWEASVDTCAGSAGPSGEEAGDLVGGVPLECVAADVVAGKGGLGAGVAQQALNVAQRNALLEPDRADGAAQCMWADGPADPGHSGGAGDVPVHRAAVHAGAGTGA
jgi:hypothetical protein